MRSAVRLCPCLPSLKIGVATLGLLWRLANFCECMTGFFVNEQIKCGFGRIARALFDKVSEDIQDRGINREII